MNEIDPLECSLKFYEALINTVDLLPIDQSGTASYRGLMKQFCTTRESAEQCAARIIAKAYRTIIKDNTSSDPELICALYHVDELEKNWQNYHDLAFIKNSINNYRYRDEQGEVAALRIIIKAYQLALGLFVEPNKVKRVVPNKVKRSNYSFANWYKSKTGIDIEEARRAGVYDLQLLEDAFNFNLNKNKL